MDTGIVEPHPLATPHPPQEQEPETPPSPSPHEIASALTHALSVESLISELGETPPRMASILFTQWLLEASPIPYHPIIVEFVYERLRPLGVEEIIGELGEEGLETMLLAALHTPQDEGEGMELEEYMDTQLAPLLARAGGRQAIAAYKRVKQAFHEQGRPGWMAAKSVWVHILNNALNHSGI